MITRINEFHAREGQSDALRQQLEALVPLIRAAPGCRACQLLQGMDDPNRFVVLEEWESVDAHQASLKGMTEVDVEPVMKLLSAPPTGAYFRQ